MKETSVVFSRLPEISYLAITGSLSSPEDYAGVPVSVFSWMRSTAPGIGSAYPNRSAVNCLAQTGTGIRV